MCNCSPVRTEVQMNYRARSDNISPLSNPKPDIIYEISQERDDPISGDEYGLQIPSKSEAVLLFSKYLDVASFEETIDIQCWNASILLPQLIVKRKLSSGDFHNCQNRRFGDL